MDCEGFFPASGVVKYGKKHKCRPCHASYRYVRDNTANWENMTNEQRRRAVVANRCENQRGRARKLHASHQVFGVVLLSCTCLGYVGVVATKPHYLYPKLGVPLQGLSVSKCYKTLFPGPQRVVYLHFFVAHFKLLLPARLSTTSMMMTSWQFLM